VRSDISAGAHRRPFERCPQAGARPVQADPCRHGLAVEHHGDLCRRQLLDRGQLQQLPVGLGQVGERTADNPMSSISSMVASDAA
jgi:hypothetical protein